MHQEQTIQHRDDMYVDMHICPPNCGGGNVELRNCDKLGLAGVPSEVVATLMFGVFVGGVEVRLLS